MPAASPARRKNRSEPPTAAPPPMTRYVPTEAQQWHPIDVRGVPMQACRLWEGDHNVESGLYRMP